MTTNGDLASIPFSISIVETPFLRAMMVIFEWFLLLGE
jgi:hypothetical protein